MKLLFVIGLALFARSNAFPTPKSEVPKQCADPTFACQDLDSARACGVVKDCINDIWATMSVPDDNDEVCDICKEMVKEARDQLLSNMTQEELKEVFEGSCELIVFKPIVALCKKLVNSFIPQLVEFCASRMDPNMVCHVSGMCFVSDKKAVENDFQKYVKMILDAKTPDECKQCTTLVVDLQTFMKSSSEADDKKFIEKICSEKIPSYLCDLFVSEYFKTFYSYIISTDATALCSSAGICPKKRCLVDDSPKVKDDLTCEFCEHVLQHVKDLVTANTTAEEFRTALLNFCKHTGNFADKCTSMVNDYYDMLFDYIRKVDTKGMCTLMGLCTDEACVRSPLIKVFPAEEPRRKVPLIKLLPASPVIRDSMPLIKLLPAEVPSKKNQIKSNDIFQSLTLNKFDHPLAVVQKYTDCAFCKAISFYIQQDLNGDTSKENVQSALDNVCDKWVKDFPEHCNRFIEKYSAKIQLFIAKGVGIDEICSQFNICMEGESPKSELNVRVFPTKHSMNGTFCDLCKDAFQQVEDVLNDPRTKAKIDQLIDQGCNILPQSVRQDCKDFLNSQSDSIISILKQELKPDNICPALKLCDESKRIQISSRAKDLECDVCKDVVTNLRQKLTDPDSKKVVLVMLEEGCKRLPESLSQECTTFVDENIDTILGIMIQNMDPDTVCSFFNICPASLVKEQPKVNDIECTVCKEVVRKLEEMVGKDNRTAERIKAALDKVCSLLPSRWSAKCENFVDKYSEIVITLLIAEMDPQTICAVINLCPESLKEEKPPKNDVECDLCKEVIGKVEDLIRDKKTEEEIQSALDKVCSYLPKSLSAQCRNFVDKYTQTIITLLMEEMDPDMVCSAMNVCPDESYFAEWKSKALDVECSGCQYFFHFIQEQLNVPETQENLKNLLKKVCSILPESLDENCEAYIDEFGDSLLVLVAHELDPTPMCHQLHMCPNMTGMLHSTSILHPFSTDECSVCTTVVDYLDKLLEEDDVDKEITKLVEKVCTILPASYVDKCSTMLETYGPYIMQMIGQLGDSKQVCQEIDLCSRPAGHVQLLGGTKCTFGPSYWCQSPAHASACKAEKFCKEKIWISKKEN